MPEEERTGPIISDQGVVVRISGSSYTKIMLKKAQLTEIHLRLVSIAEALDELLLEGEVG